MAENPRSSFCAEICSGIATTVLFFTPFRRLLRRLEPAEDNGLRGADSPPRLVESSTRSCTVAENPRSSFCAEICSGIATTVLFFTPSRLGGCLGLGRGLGPGVEIGASTGFEVGASTGFKVGASAGIEVGASSGIEVGASAGIEVGASTGFKMGASAGIEVGASAGIEVGASAGIEVGASEGIFGSVSSKRAFAVICI